MSMRMNSSQKSGVPADRSMIWDLRLAGNDSISSRLEMSVPVSAAFRGSRVMWVELDLPALHVGWLSRNSGRATQTRKTGASTDRSARCLIKPITGGFAHSPASTTALHDTPVSTASRHHLVHHQL